MRKNRNKSEMKINYKNILKIVIPILIIIIFLLIFNYVRKDKNNDKIGLIINNNVVTAKLKKDLYKNDKSVIYMSMQDVKNYLDKYIYIDKTENKIITTYGEKVTVLPYNDTNITINDSNLKILSGAELNNEDTYLPISQLSKAYNMDMTYLEEQNTLILDSLERELVTATAAKKLTVKKKDTSFSSTVDKITTGENVVLISENGKWAKIRTARGKIGYVKTSKLKNKYYVRNKVEKQEQTEKINLVWDYYSEYAKAPNRAGTTIDGVNVVSPSFFSLVSNGNGKIFSNVGTNGINYINWAKQNNYKVWAMVSNNSYKDTTSVILNSYTLRTNLINSIVDLANQYNLDGINIDFENMNESDKDMFSRFIIELKPKLQEAGKVLSVDVTAPDGGGSWSMCYNRNVIGDVADYIVFMAYDQYGSTSAKEGTTAGFNWVETNLKKFIDREEIESKKIILGIPLYTRLWTEKDGKVTSKIVNMKAVNDVLPKDVTKNWNDELKQNYVEYTKDGATYKMWIEDEESIRAKVSLVSQYNLAGTAAWAKDRENKEIWTVIKEELNKK